MGNIGKSLMHSIGLGGNTPPQQNPSTPITLNQSPENMALQDFGIPGAQALGSTQTTTPSRFVDSLFAPPTGTPPDANSDAPEAAPFKPHKRTTLGLLADMLLSGLAHKPVTPFANKAYNENLTEAMQSYSKDPQSAIGMINQFDPRLGMKLQAQYTDDHRADEVAKRLQDATDEKYLSRVAGMYNAATPENFSQIDAFARKYAKVKGLDDSAFPTNIDEAKAFAAGDVDPYQQQRLGQLDQSLKIRESDTNVSNAETHRHNVAMENKPTGKNAKASFKTVTMDGRPVGALSPDGMVARLYDRGSNTWMEFSLLRPGDINTKVFKGFIDAAGNLVDKTGTVIRKAKGSK